MSAESANGEAESRKRKREDEEGLKPAAVEMDWVAIEKELAEFVGTEAATSVVTFLRDFTENEGTEATELQRFVTLPRIDDKTIRGNLHRWVRERLSRVARSDTTSIDGEEAQAKAIRIWHIAYQSFMPNETNFERKRKQTRAPKDKPYLRFVLYKENMDTGYAMQQLQQRGGGNNRRLPKLRAGYAGMKDKRGITSQYVTVPSSKQPEHFCHVNNRKGGGGGHTQNAGVALMRVGNFEYVTDEIQLGSLQGNRFDIVLRNVQREGSADVPSMLQATASALRERGFINYFGMQRFGKHQDTHLTGLAVLKGDYEAAIDLIMSPKPDEHPQSVDARKQWQQRFSGVIEGGDRAAAEKACAHQIARQFGRFMQSEIAVVNSLARSPLKYKEAFGCISRTMRMMFVHAVQSYLWNHVASFRIAKLGLHVVEGDLVSDDNGNLSVHVVTAEDLSANKYALDDVVLPLVGRKTRYPNNASGDLYKTLLADKGLQDGWMENAGALGADGDYRRLVCHPKDVDFDILEYHDPLEPLIQTDLMKLDGIGIDFARRDDASKPLYAMKVGFTLPSSSYATVALRELMKRPTSSAYQRELKLDN